MKRNFMKFLSLVFVFSIILSSSAFANEIESKEVSRDFNNNQILDYLKSNKDEDSVEVLKDLYSDTNEIDFKSRNSLTSDMKIENDVPYNIDDEGLQQVIFYDDIIIISQLKESVSQELPESLSMARNSYKSASNTYTAVNKYFGYNMWTATVEADFSYNGSQARVLDVQGYYDTHNIAGGLWKVENEREGSTLLENGKVARAYYRGRFYYGISISLPGGGFDITMGEYNLDLRVSCNHNGKIFRN